MYIYIRIYIIYIPIHTCGFAIFVIYEFLKLRSYQSDIATYKLSPFTFDFLLIYTHQDL